MKYRPEVDGLRAIAVLAVIFFHAGSKSFSGGFLGVDVFFVISGYLITSILVAELDQDKFSLVKFYERRARRILPALFFVILCCLPFAWTLLLPSGLDGFSQSLISVSIFASNVLFWSESGYFDVATHYKPLLHTWSLAVEEQYYIIFPVFLLLCWRFGKTALFRLLLVLLVVCTAIAYWGVLNKPNAAFYLLPFRAWELLIGACVGFYLYQNANHFKLRSFLAHQVLSLVGLLMILCALLLHQHTITYLSLYGLLPTLGTALIILFASKDTITSKLLSIKPMVGIGLISYSAYLWHQPIFSFARHASSGEPPTHWIWGLSILIFPLSWLSWRYIERPFRDRSSLDQRAIFRLAAIASGVAISLGGIGVLSNGFLSRYDANDQYLAALDSNTAGKYVRKRFDSRLMHSFDMTSNKTKVLLIGDSYGKDLINAMYEAGLNQGFQFSTRHIPKECGNLFIKFDQIKAHISNADLRYCKQRNLLDDAALLKLLKVADEIWFVSAWSGWQAEKLPESLKRLAPLSKRIRVFGVKSLGKVNIKQMLSLSEQERLSIQNKPSKDSVATNKIIRDNIPKSVFVDIQSMLCPPDGLSCPAFIKEEGLISYDGGHLTKAGAAYLGALLKQELLQPEESR